MKRVIAGLLVGASLLTAALTANAYFVCQARNQGLGGAPVRSFFSRQCGVGNARAVAYSKCRRFFPNCYIVPGSCHFVPPHC